MRYSAIAEDEAYDHWLDIEGQIESSKALVKKNICLVSVCLVLDAIARMNAVALHSSGILTEFASMLVALLIERRCCLCFGKNNYQGDGTVKATARLVGARKGGGG